MYLFPFLLPIVTTLGFIYAIYLDRTRNKKSMDYIICASILAFAIIIFTTAIALDLSRED
jgi:hypothetical protein